MSTSQRRNSANKTQKLPRNRLVFQRTAGGRTIAMNLAYPMPRSGLMDALSTAMHSTTYQRSSFAIQELLGLNRNEKSSPSNKPSADAITISPSMYRSEMPTGHPHSGLMSWPPALMAFSPSHHPSVPHSLGLAAPTDFYRQHAEQRKAGEWNTFLFLSEIPSFILFSLFSNFKRQV